jgi:Ca2+-binding RTX toxin-like protein
VSFGTTEADTLDVTGTKNLVFAGFGNDTVNVSQGNNRIYGDGGDDAFFLGTGDYVVGGEGSDQFWVADTEFPDAANRIADFELDSDVIGLSNLGTSFEDLTLTQSGDNTLIAIEEKAVAILTNIDANSLDADNFAFN